MARAQAVLLAFIGGCWAIHGLAVLPGWQFYTVLGLLTAVVLLISRHWQSRVILLPVLGLLAGFVYTSLRAEYRLSDTLAAGNVDRVTRVHLRVASLPVLDQHGWHFEAQVLNADPAGVPGRIRVRWSEPVWRGPYAAYRPGHSRLPSVQPGQLWRMALVLRPVHGNLNPGGFDYERHAFAQGVRAVGKVRGTPWLLSRRPGLSPVIWVQRWRHNIRSALQPLLNKHEYGGVLLALSLGDQSSIAPSHWDIFRRTGLSHLVAISGTHVSLIAGMGAALTSWVWRRLSWRRRPLSERVPVAVAAGAVALVLAAIYCLLAGWGIPAQRTFITLATGVGLLMSRVSVASASLLSVAAFAVVLFDPWAMLSSGFWLSFGAVAVLIFAAASAGRVTRQVRQGWPARLWRNIRAATRLQWLITVSLLVPLAVLFNEVSLVSPVANAYAIVIISTLVTPLALLAALFVQIPGAAAVASTCVDMAHHVLALMMAPTQWLANQSLASVAVAQPGRVAVVLGLLGSLIALLPRGIPFQRLAWLGVLPALLGVSKRLPHGAWEATVLDVGQAGAIAVRTAHHTLLFDAGLRYHAQADDGGRVIVPFLRYRGWRALDTLVLSHADLDHVGGLRSVLVDIPVRHALASFELADWLANEAEKLGDVAQPVALPRTSTWCRKGQRWEVDGVVFEMLWPQDSVALPAARQTSKMRNSGSCVLSIRGRYHALLLPGDINAAQERILVEQGLGRHDAVVAAHHGSRGSSTHEFAQATSASHVIMQAGAWSPYGHPHPDAIARWKRVGSEVWRSDHHGAVTLCSCAPQLEVTGQRQVRARYWHHHYFEPPN